MHQLVNKRILIISRCTVRRRKKVFFGCCLFVAAHVTTVVLLATTTQSHMTELQTKLPNISGVGDAILFLWVKRNDITSRGLVPKQDSGQCARQAYKQDDKAL